MTWIFHFPLVILENTTDIITIKIESSTKIGFVFPTGKDLEEGVVLQPGVSRVLQRNTNAIAKSHSQLPLSSYSVVSRSVIYGSEQSSHLAHESGRIFLETTHLCSFQNGLSVVSFLDYPGRPDLPLR